MYQNRQNLSFNRTITKSVKFLLIVNIVVFLFQQIISIIRLNEIFIYLFGLSHTGFIENLHIWQVFTYMFLHGGWLHIFFNCFALWMFGCELERLWGPKRFMQYYIFSGIGAGIFIVLMNIFINFYYGAGNIPTIGASGAIYALLLAYGMTWPNREVLVYFLFPIKMKYLVLIFGAMEFFGTLHTATGVSGGISHIGHLGGIIAGFIMLNILDKSVSSSKNKKTKNVVQDMIKKRRLDKHRELINKRKKAKEIIDKMLEKIGRSGLDSLSPQEKKDLEWARKNYYPENNDTIH